MYTQERKLVHKIKKGKDQKENTPFGLLCKEEIMASIYRRSRIRIPKIIFQNFKGIDIKKNNKKIKFLVIITVAIVTFVWITRAVEPIYEGVCKEKAKSVATLICNEESTKIINEYKYEDLVTIHRDKEDNVAMIEANVKPINLMISDVGEKIQKRINEIENEKIYIALGSITGSRFLSGFGPQIPIKVSLIGNIETDLRSEFEEKGINQTIHRIYLQVDCKISVLTPAKLMEEGISNQVLIAENVIVGKIPDTYYNLEGIGTDNLLDVVE